MDTKRFDALSKALAGQTSRRMAVGRIAGGGVAGSLLVAAGLGRARAAAQGEATPMSAEAAPFNGGFSATVYQGPNKGFTLSGSMELTRDGSGRLTGRLVPESGDAVPVTGQLTGSAVNLVFYLPEDKQIFGVGTLGQRPDTGRWVLGGPLVGPDEGDSGDWKYCLECYYDVVIGTHCVQIPCPKAALQ